MEYKLNKLNNKLFIIATPIGNLEEISKRTFDTLKDCDILFCEDTRVTNRLLNKLNINNKTLISYQKFNENEKVDDCINKIKSFKCGLISDAGYPCLSDPGYALVNKCYENNIGVEVINGPCSVIHAIVASGINLNNFMFIGFLNASNYQRRQKLKTLSGVEMPIILFESVHRIHESLKDIYELLNDPYLVICRELTKINETIYRGHYNDVKNFIVDKGEFVIIVKNKKQIMEISINDKLNEIKTLIKENIKAKDACKIIAEKYNDNSSNLYKEYLKDKNNEY